MPFTSPLFVVFIIGFLFLFWAIELKSRKAALRFTAVASLAFIAINFPLFTIILIVQALLVLIYQRVNKSRLSLAVIISLLLLPLLMFKYYDFIAATIGISEYGFSLPLGISFYTFTAIGFVVDMHMNKYRIENPGFIDNLNLLTFWPHLASGPILRGNNFFGKEYGKSLLKRDIVTAIVLLVFGLYKKIVIADGVGGLVNQNLEYGIDSMSSFAAWSTVIGFSARIYGDFSGYSDMAIGFAILLGIYIPANFNYPYSAGSITQFWRKWHISLSTWFRDYVYIPLGGKKNGLFIGSVVLMIVFTLSGLWHGAAWNFVIWGALHGFILIAERIFRKLGLKLPYAIGWIFTITVVSLAWSFFFLDFNEAVSLLQRTIIGSSETSEYNTVAIWFYAGLVAFDSVVKPYRVTKGRIKSTRAGIILTPIILTICFYFAGKSLPFIYFDF